MKAAALALVFVITLNAAAQTTIRNYAPPNTTIGGITVVGLRPRAHVRAARSTIEPAARYRLQQITMSVDYQDTPFETVLNDLRRQGLKIIALWPALEAAGYAPDDLVTLTLDNVSAQQVLTLTLRALSAGGPQPLGFRHYDDVIEIAPQQPIAARKTTRVYYIADLSQPAVRAFDNQSRLINLPSR